jgi:cell division control protein 24
MGPKMRNKNARLQLKGRIFMTNVTDVVSLSKPGLYTLPAKTDSCADPI